jgi:hypothetical protein
LWWRGEPYVKSSLLENAVDEEIDVLNESKDIVEGTWRRMFEIDLRYIHTHYRLYYPLSSVYCI